MINLGKNDMDECSTRNDCSLSLSFPLLHFIILSKNNCVLKKILEMDIVPLDDWVKAEELVELEKEKRLAKFVDKENRWIFETTCLHIASRFNARGLTSLFSFFEQKIQQQEDKQKKKEIKEIFRKAWYNSSTTPLHIAANVNNMSLR